MSFALRLTEGECERESLCELSRSALYRLLVTKELFLAKLAEESFKIAEGIIGFIARYNETRKPHRTVKITTKNSIDH